jgi:hypothetical protein
VIELATILSAAVRTAVLEEQDSFDTLQPPRLFKTVTVDRRHRFGKLRVWLLAIELSHLSVSLSYL